MRVRGATAADLDAVQAIEVASFSDPWRRDAFRESLSNSHGVFLVAEDAADDAVLGYCVGHRVADEAEVANLAVDPARRGAGVGEALLRAFLARIDAVPPRATVYLEVRRSNAAALRLYARHGFEASGVRRGYYDRPREDALVLRRLPPPVTTGSDGSPAPRT